MMQLKGYNFILCLLISISTYAQFSLSGVVLNEDGLPVMEAEIYISDLQKSTVTDGDGNYYFDEIELGSYRVIVFGFEYELQETIVELDANQKRNFSLIPLGEQLSEVVLVKRREKIFALRSLKQVEGTAIYAGKKSEVVLLDQLTANLAVNSPRQIYSQVVGLNIYENGDAGLQLNIGGRGLDPNRSANFNIRQNNYDISADVLGYPESYYTPPAEGLSEIQVIRGAASLQYGTQFGGLINFKTKRPNPSKEIEWVTRQTAGSFGLLTSFNSLSGTVGKFSYFTYFNYKEGDGWRDNSRFHSRNYFAHLGYQISKKTKLEGELTVFNYTAKQAGGLTDVQFNQDPSFSNRSRNWFNVDWKVYSLRLNHEFSKGTNFSLQLFGLDATRKAVGFRENRVSQADDLELPRELLVDNFMNWGAETRFLHTYEIGGKEAVLLVGSKYYHSENDQFQGPGTTGLDANFASASLDFPNYQRQAEFTFPNRNLAVFGEHIFNISDKLAITPGFRWEYIKTESAGFYRNIVLDLAGNPILNEAVDDDRVFDRNFVLLGTGITYRFNKSAELYANISQNYRSVTFSDIRVVNPSFVIDENISDEEGYTFDAGLRGRVGETFSYDTSLFALRYDERLGEVLFQDTDGSIKRRRGNIGDALIYGLEIFSDVNLQSVFTNKKDHRLHVFGNFAYTQSEYLNSDAVGVEGNSVEFIPEINFKTGLQYSWKNFASSFQFSYLSKQFTDATNAPQDLSDNQRGIEGSIPAYSIVDASVSYVYKKWKIETGVNNVLNTNYFTRRATGYPGPGIIPAEPLSVFTTLQFKW